MIHLNNIERVALLGFGLAVAFGAIANKTNFCTMGAVSDWVNMGDTGRLRAWFLAIGIAILGSQALQGLGYVDLGQSIYLTTNFGWLGSLVGGFLFGVGMTLGSGCGQRTLVRVGNGNLKSLVVMLMLGITAATTLYGVLALVRIHYIEVTNINLSSHGMPNQGIDSAIVALTGLKNAKLVHWVVTGVMGFGLVLFSFSNRDFRKNFDNVLAGAFIGLAVVAAWYITGKVGHDDFNPIPVESFTFVAPISDALQYVMTFTGSTIKFSIVAVFGVIVGSFLYAVASGKFRIETFTSRSDMVNHLFGGMLMGFGGIVGLGCTIGQGVTGVSTLAMGSLMTLMSIIFGSALTMKVQYYMLDEQGFFRALFSGLADFRLLPRRRIA
ncbi:MAG: YeeE/YedE family protein [Gammaproteobacteria bacterium]|nr:YeeE/YedE family protein [Gammaproteobacteria bacterium]